MSPNNAQLRELVLIALRRGRSQFLDACPYPALVPRAVNIGDLQRSQSDREGDTMQYIPTVSEEVSMFESPTVLLLRRNAQLGEGQVIRLGRTVDSDLVLPDHSVSKEHASFHRVGFRHWELEDTFSKNGTWIEDMRLIPGVPVKVESKEELRFGRIHLRFFSPEDLYWEILETAPRPPKG